MCKKGIFNKLDFSLMQIRNGKFSEVPATLENVEYRCQIINNILRTTLTQTFRSQSDNEYSETHYLFPIEDEICLEFFEARYNDSVVRGIVKSNEEATKEYQDNKNKGNLVSFASYQKTSKEDQIKIKLGNLPPNSQIEIVLTFTQQLNSIFNTYYVANIPLQFIENEEMAVEGKNVLTLDLFCTGKIQYSNSRGYPAEKIEVDENTVRFNLSQALVQKEQNFQLIYSYEGMFDPQVILGSSKVFTQDSAKRSIQPVNQSAMVSFIPNFNSEISQEIDDTIRAAINNGDDILSDEFQQKLNQEMVDHLNSSRSEFLFLLDRSGSMSGRAINKAKEALILFLKSLPNDSYFNVISFGSDFVKLFPTSKQYTSKSLEEAIEQIHKFKADLGGTEIYQPLLDIFTNEKKIKGYNKQIFLLTDGEVTQPSNVVNLIRKNNKYNRIHSIGFGSGADKFLIEKSAIAGKGISQIIKMNQDLSEIIINMLASSITPTYDEFKITYDKSIIESTYPISTNFPCVFKDEIINIHFFFKLLVDISSLTDDQKKIKIEYYDSQLKQTVNKEIKLEMSDCFTCNAELQESVFKLGKQLYLNEKISSSEKPAQELIQQAIDYQLLTEKTSIICVIETLNDAQQVQYETISHDVTYSNQIQQIQPMFIGQKFLMKKGYSCSNIQQSQSSSYLSNNAFSGNMKKCKKASLSLSTKMETEDQYQVQSLNRKRRQVKQSNQFFNEEAEESDGDNCEENNYSDLNATMDDDCEESLPTKKLKKQSLECQEEISSKREKSKKDIEIVSFNLETIIRLVDNRGVWTYNENFIKQYSHNINPSQLKNILSQLKNNDAFMTLLVLCVLEKFYNNEKSKWILISKKSTSFIKDNLQSNTNFSTLKQNIIEKITQ